MEETEDGANKRDSEKLKNNREIYFKKLRSWLDEARLWYSLAANFPSPTNGSFPMFPNNMQNMENPYVAFYAASVENQRDRRFPNYQTPNVGANANAPTFNGVPFYQTYPFIFPPNVLRLPTTYEFKIPPLWKRLCAETIDFLILLLLKLGLTFLFVESFSIGKALDLYAFDILQKGILEGPELNFPFAYELVALEFLHRFLVCAFETYFLRGKSCATPGKRCMGLMVVNVEHLASLPNRPPDIVSATGVKAPGWQRALLRSVVKNLIVGLLLPLCITFYLFPYNRTSYDMMANTLVVERHPEFLLYQALTVR